MTFANPIVSYHPFVLRDVDLKEKVDFTGKPIIRVNRNKLFEFSLSKTLFGVDRMKIYIIEAPLSRSLPSRLRALFVKETSDFQ